MTVNFICRENLQNMSGDNIASDWMDPLQIKKDGAMNVNVPDLDKLFELDPYLKDHEREIKRR